MFFNIFDTNTPIVELKSIDPQSNPLNGIKILLYKKNSKRTVPHSKLTTEAQLKHR